MILYDGCVRAHLLNFMNDDEQVCGTVWMRSYYEQYYGIRIEIT